MKNLRLIFTSALVVSGFSAMAQSVWLPKQGELVATPGYTYQTYDKFLAGKTEVKLPADIVQHNGFISLEYGITPQLAADATIGYVRVEFDPPGGPNFKRDGLDDTRFGLRYRLVDENAGNQSWIPAVALRAGGIIAGTYEVPTTLPPINPGDGANGFETSLLFGKTLGETGFGIYGDFGGRIRDHDVPADIFGTAGVFKRIGPVTLNFDYRHTQGLSGGDIGGPGFGTTFGFPQVKEITQLRSEESRTRTRADAVMSSPSPRNSAVGTEETS